MASQGKFYKELMIDLASQMMTLIRILPLMVVISILQLWDICSMVCAFDTHVEEICTLCGEESTSSLLVLRLEMYIYTGSGLVWNLSSIEELVFSKIPAYL